MRAYRVCSGIDWSVLHLSHLCYNAVLFCWCHCSNTIVHYSTILHTSMVKDGLSLSDTFYLNIKSIYIFNNICQRSQLDRTSTRDYVQRPNRRLCNRRCPAGKAWRIPHWCWRSVKKIRASYLFSAYSCSILTLLTSDLLTVCTYADMPRTLELHYEKHKP